MRFILAIDPGTFDSAFVYWDAQEKKILNKGILSNEDLLHYIIDYYKPGSNTDVMVIEGIASYGMSVGASVFSTCVWIGRFWQASRYPVHLIYRKEVKSFLCGSMKAKDSNIRQALIDLIGPQGTKKAPGPTHGVKADEWSALALAVTFATRHEKENVNGKSINRPVAG